jgi:hypothetical protein
VGRWEERVKLITEQEALKFFPFIIEVDVIDRSSSWEPRSRVRARLPGQNNICDVIIERVY